MNQSIQTMNDNLTSYGYDQQIVDTNTIAARREALKQRLLGKNNNGFDDSKKIILPINNLDDPANTSRETDKEARLEAIRKKLTAGKSEEESIRAKREALKRKLMYGAKIILKDE